MSLKNELLKLNFQHDGHVSFLRTLLFEFRISLLFIEHDFEKKVLESSIRKQDVPKLVPYLNKALCKRGFHLSVEL